MNVASGLSRRLLPAVDDPVFEDRYWGDGGDEVLVLEPEDDPARAYPRRLLAYHGVVDDELGDTPVAVTWCPLARCGVAYERSVAGRTLTLEFAGSLADDNLVLRDRETGSLWKQSLGECFSGDLAGEQLAVLPATTTTWAAFREGHPDGVALARPDEEPPAAFPSWVARLSTGLASPRRRWVARALAGLLNRLPGVGGEDVDLGAFYRLSSAWSGLRDRLVGPVARLTGRSQPSATAYDETPLAAYAESATVGLPVVGERREWWRVDFGPKTPVVGVTVGDDALGFPRSKVIEAGGVATATVGGTGVVVVATPEGSFAYEQPGLAFEPSEVAGTVWGDGVLWDAATGEAADGRRLARLPARDVAAFAWADDHGPGSFWPRSERRQEAADERAAAEQAAAGSEGRTP